MIDISIIIPVYNSSNILPELIKRINNSLSKPSSSRNSSTANIVVNALDTFSAFS